MIVAVDAEPEHVAQPTIEGVITCEVAIHHVRDYVLRLRIHAGDHTTD